MVYMGITKRFFHKWSEKPVANSAIMNIIVNCSAD
jgi:hypothetical protein